MNYQFSATSYQLFRMKSIETSVSEEKEKLEISKPEETAAGLDAAISTARNVFGKMGVVRGTRGMLKINQAGGFDCPSCAWPDPESHRTFAEFCENGAKAMADEATTKRIGRRIFREVFDRRTGPAKRSMAERPGPTDRAFDHARGQPAL